MDMVYGIIRLDVPAYPGITSGLRLETDKLSFAPCLPEDWETFKIHYRYRETIYHITVLQTRTGKGATRVMVDGVELEDRFIPLVDDRQEHSVEVRIPVPDKEKGKLPGVT